MTHGADRRWRVHNQFHLGSRLVLRNSSESRVPRVYPRYLRVPRVLELINSHHLLLHNLPRPHHIHLETEMIRGGIKEVTVDLVVMDRQAIIRKMVMEGNLRVARTAMDHPTEGVDHQRVHLEMEDHQRVHLEMEDHQMAHRMALAARGMVKTNLTKMMTQLFGKWRTLSQSWRKPYLQRMETPGSY